MDAVAHVHGIELFYETHGAGEPLLLLHGGFGTGADFRRLFDVAALAQRYRVVIPDLRGHGRSTNPSGRITPQTCARDVLALADALGVARFSAIALSLGAKTMLHVATLAPARVEAMVLAAATPSFPDEARRLMRAVSDAGPSERELADARAHHLHGDEQIRALWRMPRDLADDETGHDFSAARLATIRARTLVVNGDRDPLYPVELSVALYRAIPRASLWVLPDAGHAPVFDHARAFAETALAFLRGDRL